MTEPEVTGRPRGSPISRATLLAYLLLIIYASWYPFSGWRDSGVPPLAFLNLAKQRYWTGFDVTVNIIGYIPFGVLLVLSLYPRIRGVWAVLLAAIGGALVSGTMEAVQNYLPSRVPSNLDFITNSGGCLVGAVLGALWAPILLDRSRLFHLRRRWFAPHASQGLVLVALWPLAQIYPQSYLFGHGQVLPIISGWLSKWLDEDIDLVAMLRPGAEGGFLIGLIMLSGLVFAPQVAQRRLAVVTLVLSLIVVNTIPVNPYFSSTLQGWVQGKFLNFNGAAQFLSLMWPFFALWFLLLPSHKLNRQ